MIYRMIVHKGCCFVEVSYLLCNNEPYQGSRISSQFSHRAGIQPPFACPTSSFLRRSSGVGISRRLQQYRSPTERCRVCCIETLVPYLRSVPQESMVAIPGHMVFRRYPLSDPRSFQSILIRPKRDYSSISSEPKSSPGTGVQPFRYTLPHKKVK
jgi:hypothetical protein